MEVEMQVEMEVEMEVEMTKKGFECNSLRF